ncbi:IS21 family transposase [Tuanshanicoccus lijuaniae]|uniref:IS21 family transposase n=1 Tax=Aerococcaceae bacterium zg-1292 TaxID=2774330 RepID=UPI004062B718
MNKVPLQYAQFCHQFTRYLEQSKATMTFQHTPGEKIEVDWAGQTMELIDFNTGEATKGYLFVATLPYSQYSYAEVTTDMKQESWIQAHINLFKFLGGTPSIIICDNLKTGVVTHPRNGEIILNKAYQELGDYYHTAIIPAKPRTPKGKASVEGTVGKLSTQLIARCRNNRFEGVHEANLFIRPLLDDFNQKAFQKRSGSRIEVFNQEEKVHLKPLPKVAYEYDEWKIATVQYHYHISIEKMMYSVPFQFIKKKVDVRITKQLIEVYYQQVRICSHKRLYGHPGQYSTKETHMPPNHVKNLEWNADRFINWASKIGPKTQCVIERLLKKHPIEQQAYNSCRSILKLSDRYSDRELESTCEQALSITDTPIYRNIKRIIETNKTLYEANPTTHRISSDHVALRGNEYFGGK